MPKVSIITPLYNSSDFIAETIESVLNQTYSEWEMIIVDDCSTDNSVEIVKEYANKDKRINLIVLEENIGAAAARNVALENASGRFIAFLDSDDLWKSDKLKKQTDFMKKNNIAFSFSSYEVINQDGSKTGKTINAPMSISYSQYLKNTIIGCLTVLIDKSKTGDFKMPLIKSSHDMALWLLLMRKGILAYGINETLASYRLVENSNTAQKWKAAKDVWKVYRDIEKLSLLYSAFCFIGYSFNAAKKRYSDGK